MPVGLLQPKNDCHTSRLSYLSKGQSVVTTIRTPSSLKVPSKMQLVVALTTGVSTLGNMGCQIFKEGI